MDRESRRKGTWSTEAGGPSFRGASDSVIEGHRPNLALDPGRRSNWPWVLAAFVLLVGGIAGGTYYFWDDIEQALTSTPEETAAATTGEAGTGESGATGESGETGASGPTGASGASGATGPTASTGAGAQTGTSGATAPSGESGVPHAWPPPGDQRFPGSEGGSDSGSPAATGATGTTGSSTTGGNAPPATGSTGGTPTATPTVSLLELKISGISKSRAEKNLGDLVAMTTTCLADTGGGVTKGELSIRMTVKWNGRSSGVSVTGAGMPTGLLSCVRKKLPRARYPQPRPGKDGVIRAKLKIGN